MLGEIGGRVVTNRTDSASLHHAIGTAGIKAAIDKSRQNCKHEWKVVSLDTYAQGTTDLRLICTCDRCDSWTYKIVAFIGYRLENVDDKLELEAERILVVPASPTGPAKLDRCRRCQLRSLADDAWERGNKSSSTHLHDQAGETPHHDLCPNRSPTP